LGPGTEWRTMYVVRVLSQGGEVRNVLRAGVPTHGHLPRPPRRDHSGDGRVDLVCAVLGLLLEDG
jgi:hypothetical protein